jgi:uncharacterized membrane protein
MTIYILISILVLLIIAIVVFFVSGKKKEIMKNLNLVQFILGIILALTAGTLLFLGILPSSASSIIGIVGIALIGTSFRYKR